jgi:preprotein translocase subunit SecF
MSDTTDATTANDSEDTTELQDIEAEYEVANAPLTAEERRHGVFSRLYHGETRANIVGRWKHWFALSAIVIIIGAVALSQRGLNLGIDFTGGTVWKVPAGHAKVADVTDAMAKLGYEDVEVQEVTQSSGADKGRFISVKAEASADPAAKTTSELTATEKLLSSLASAAPKSERGDVNDVLSQVRGIDGPFRTTVPPTLTDLEKQIRATHAAVEKAKGDSKQSAAVRSGVREMQKQVTSLSAQESAERQRVGGNVSEKLAELTGSKVSQVTVDTVGPSWGREISQKARNALIVFLIAITLYITLRFEFRMAVATLAALVHDLVIVVGIYAVFGFPVTPATVIAILTILGFSIYDGIVVFDRVDENTTLLGKRAKITYSEMANTSLNQVLMRSLNTSITALLPILSVLVIGAGFLGATTLEEFGLALFLGLLSGAYSSIFIATPLLAMLKEREPRYRELRGRVEAQRSAADAMPAAAGAGAGADPVPSDIKTSRGRSLDDVAGAAPAGSAPRPRKQGKKR